MHHSSKTFGLLLSLLLAVCLFGHIAQAKYGSSGMAASGETSTYVFVPDQSKVVQTGGIAGVHWTYSIKGQFQLTVNRDAADASFAHVDANATDDSPFKRTLDLNHVFNMTSLVGTVHDDTTISFTGKASDGSDVRITVTLTDDLAHLIGQTTPPPNSADFFIFSLDAVAQRKYGSGSGTAEDPYQIATAADLILLGDSPDDYDKHFILTADIDLDPNLPGRKVFDKAVIGLNYDTPFRGIFDGNGYTISHLTIRGGDQIGLFSCLGSGAEVKNLGVVDVNIIGSGYSVGGLVGYNGAIVTQCFSTGAVSGDWAVGGLAGSNGNGDWLGTGGVLTHCHSDCTVSGNCDVGGLVGSNLGAVTQCCSSGPVRGTGTNLGLGGVGGLVGTNGAWAQYFGLWGSVTRSYSTGTVSGEYDVGGLVGMNWSDVTECFSTGAVNGEGSVGGLVGNNGDWPEAFGGTVTRCYSTGAVSGNWAVGGLIGQNAMGRGGGSGTVTASFWDTQTSFLATSDGGTGKTTAEMQTASTFLDAGWDFVNVWGIGENQTYPYLRKYSAADINQDASVNFLDLALLAENWLTGMAP
jgi:hypothetical protein